MNPIVAKLMVNRHIDVDEGRQFLQGTLSDLLDPFTLKDMDVAVSLVQETIEVTNQSSFMAIMMWMVLLQTSVLLSIF